MPSFTSFLSILGNIYLKGISAVFPSSPNTKGAFVWSENFTLASKPSSSSRCTLIFGHLVLHLCWQEIFWFWFCILQLCRWCYYLHWICYFHSHAVASVNQNLPMYCMECFGTDPNQKHAHVCLLIFSGSIAWRWIQLILIRWMSFDYLRADSMNLFIMQVEARSQFYCRFSVSSAVLEFFFFFLLFEGS